MQWVNAIPTLAHLWSSIHTLGHLCSSIPTLGHQQISIPTLGHSFSFTYCSHHLWSHYVHSGPPPPPPPMGPTPRPLTLGRPGPVWQGGWRSSAARCSSCRPSPTPASPWWCPSAPVKSRRLPPACSDSDTAPHCPHPPHPLSLAAGPVPGSLPSKEPNTWKVQNPAKSQTRERFKTQQRAKQWMVQNPAKEPNIWKVQNPAKSQTRERFKTQQRAKHGNSSKECYFLGQKNNVRISGVIPFIKLQNDT